MIKFSKTGFSGLSEEEKGVFNKLASDYSPKIERAINNIGQILIRLKEYHSLGKRKKYSLHAKVIVPGKTIEVEASEWDLAVTLHKIFKRIIESAQKNFRVGKQYKRK
jgi:hypothetical protein